MIMTNTSGLFLRHIVEANIFCDVFDANLCRTINHG